LLVCFQNTEKRQLENIPVDVATKKLLFLACKFKKINQNPLGTILSYG
jgi:hypothetical protein